MTKHHEFTLTTSDGTSLFGQSWSPKQTPVCSIGIVHGLGEHSSRYEPIANHLVEAGFQVVSYDQRGHGKSKGQMPSFQTLLNDIDTLLEQMTRLSPSPRFLYGQSLGGGLVIHYALQRRPSIAGIIASSPLLRTATDPPAWKLWVGRTLGKIWPSLQLATGINANELTHDRQAVERYLNDSLVHRRVSAALGMSMLDAGVWSLENAASLSLPMLLMHGTADRITCSKASEQFAQSAHPTAN